MGKWTFLAKHAFPSLVGILRLILGRPGFGFTLLVRRVVYFFTRAVRSPLVTPEGFLINTPDTLVAYWSMFVEHELDHPLWRTAIQRASSPCILDVGANAGVFSLYAHSLNPASIIHCFEPLPAMVRRIEDLTQRSGMNLTCHPIAVSDRQGEALFQSPEGAEGTSSFVRPGQAGSASFPVKTDTLDALAPHRPIDLIKIDVEGFETSVIRGATRTLSQARFLIIEAQNPVHLAEITALLEPSWVRVSLGESDFLFHREKSSS